MQQIQDILNKVKTGTDCTEEESAEIKMFVKEIHIPGDGSAKLIEQIQLLLPTEYGEAIDEINGSVLKIEIVPAQESGYFIIYHIVNGQRAKVIAAKATGSDFDFLRAEDIDKANDNNGGFFEIQPEDAVTYFYYNEQNF